MWSRNGFRAWINQHRLAVERILDDDVVVVITPMQLHGDRTRRNPHRSQHGSQKDDVIVELDGLTTRHTEGELMAHLLQKHNPGAKVKALVLRGKERVSLQLPMQ